MEEFEYLVVWNDSDYIVSFGYLKKVISKDDLKELDTFLQYHKFRYTVHDTQPFDTGFDKRVENIKDVRMKILDIVR